MAFGDVNLATDQIHSAHGVDQNPGDGGWPTIRYFNKATGYGGAPYSKKTDGAMCDELGDDNYMQAYVEEQGGVLLCEDFDCLCSRREGGACEKREIDYYGKHKNVKRSEIQSKLSLLSRSLQMAAKKDPWMTQRVSILKLLDAVAAKADEGKAEL